MADQQWHLSKAVPVSFVLAIFIQTVALIWFVASLSSDVENNKSSISNLKLENREIRNVVNNQEVTLGRIDENIKSIRDFIERLPTTVNERP
jgi:hypothetical protein|tara:strand:+ start:1474 stop:1749 length:276 start_codon:yes stop_codon:yes gene_type:complete